MDCSNSEEPPSPSIVLVFPLISPFLNAKKMANTVIKDVYNCESVKAARLEKPYIISDI